MSGLAARAGASGRGPVSALMLALWSALALSCESIPKSRESGEALTVAPASARGAVSIPEGAGGALAKKQPVVYLDISTIDACKDAELRLEPSAIQLARTQLEAMLPRMKRFTVYSIYNDAGMRKARELGDTGIAAEVEQTQLPAPDLLLNITATINSELNEDLTRQEQLLVCTATVVYSLTDASGKVLTDTQWASGIVPTTKPRAGQKLSEMKNVRKLVRYYDVVTKTWEYAGGFQPKNQESAAALVKQTIEDPLKGLAARLALALPVTTEVTGLTPTKTQFAVRAGQRNGIFRGTKVVVWCEQDDFSYAIAETTAEPTMDKANLKVLSWNDADPDAKAIVDRIRSGGIPDELKGKLWATTEGIPIEEMLAP